MSVRRFLLLAIIFAAAILGVMHFAGVPHVGRQPATSTVSASQTTLFNVPADATNRGVLDNIDKYVDTPAGYVSWHIFGATKESSIEGKTKDGYDFQYYKPGFTPQVSALNGKEITVKGFMFPLDEDKGQTLFLFGPFPVNCPFHYHVGPALVMEVHTDKKPIDFSYDAITLKGRLQLVPQDEENSTFYRLVDAKVVKS